MRDLRRGLALGLAVFSLLPVVNWYTGELSAPWYGPVGVRWLLGSTIVLGVGIIVAIVWGRIDRSWPSPTPASTHTGALILTGLAVLAYVMVAIGIFSGRPLQIDELVQVFQARIFTEGRLWAAASVPPEFSAIFNVVDAGGRVYGQFPPGGPAMLALGTLVGAAWLVGPVAGGISVWLAGVLFRRLGLTRGVTLAAMALFAFAPFVLFMSGTHMNHVTTLTWLFVYLVGTVITLTSDERRPWIAFAAGGGLGVAATIRPLDAVAFAVPGALWYAVVAYRDRRRAFDGLACGFGLLLPLVVLLAVNTATTGAPLRFAYNVLWGREVGLGFHASPWGEPHTPLRAVALSNLYLLRLHLYLFEWPIPSALFALLAIASVRTLSAADRFLLACSGTLVAAYAVYWHDGFYLGPRFLYPIVPMVALWTARLPGLIERHGSRFLSRLTIGAIGTCVVMAVSSAIPERAGQYAQGLSNVRWDVDRAAAEQNVTDALVLVRESWGAQLMARMWAAGVSRSDAERFYRYIDACALETALDETERRDDRSGAVAVTLEPLLADSARLVRSPFSPDPTLRWNPNAIYTATCRTRLAQESEGFALLPPLLLSRRDDLVFVRDLHDRNAVLLDRYPEKRVFLLKPPPLETEPVFIPLSRDSLRMTYERRPLPD